MQIFGKHLRRRESRLHADVRGLVKSCATLPLREIARSYAVSHPTISDCRRTAQGTVYRALLLDQVTLPREATG